MPPVPDAAGPTGLTFILPTRNRRAWVGRAIESCLAVAQADLLVEVLVVDGNSTDGSFAELQERYGRDPRVRLMRQQGAKGFMPACFFAVPLVRTTFATFMYDDDVLSPFWADLPREMRRRGADFILGFGAEEQLEKVFPFRRPTQVRVTTPSFLLRAYCGCGHGLSSQSLPFTPVCCLTRTDRLREWLGELEEFTRGRPLREYFMMQRNAGPDLMIYFCSIAGHAGEIPVMDGPVAQLSAHAESFTSGLDPADLPVGYWLAHLWLCGRLRRLHRGADAGWCSAYTFKLGLRLAFKRCRRGNWAWLGPLSGEIAGLLARSLAGGGAVSFAKSLLVLLLPRRWRPQFGLSTRTEPLLH